VSLLSRRQEALYGHGTLDQALEYANGVKRRHDTICRTSALTDEEAQELRLENNTEAFSLPQALAEG
jgi:hypothetical protein